MARKGNELWVVDRGDTLIKVAKEVYGDSRQYKVLAEANRISNPDVVNAGQKIKLPATLKGLKRKDEDSKAVKGKDEDGKSAGGGGSGKPTIKATANLAKSLSLDDLANYLYYGRVRFLDAKNLKIEHAVLRRTLEFKSRDEFKKFMQSGEQRMVDAILDDDRRKYKYLYQGGRWPVKGTVPKRDGKEITKKDLQSQPKDLLQSP